MNLVLTIIQLLCLSTTFAYAAEQLPDPNTMKSSLPLTRENYTPSEDVVRYNQRHTFRHQCPICQYMEEIRNPALVKWRAWDSLYLLILQLTSED